MKILVRNEIIEALDDADWQRFMLTLYEAANKHDFSIVNFNMDNSQLIELDDNEVIQYLILMDIDPDDILKVSTLLADGFITTMRNYSLKLKEMLTGN